MLRH
jgi:proline dehydrogenase